MKDFRPLNELESRLLAAHRNDISVGEFVHGLLSSDLVVPSATEVRDDGSGFEPVIFDKNGTSMLALFTAKERAVQIERIAQFCLVMKGKDILRRIPKGVGIVLNPGLSIGFELSVGGIAEILADFGMAG